MTFVPYTVLIVDDHAGFRASARAVLEANDQLGVIGEAASGTDAVTQAFRLRPDIVLLDIALPDVDGFAVCDSIMRNETLQSVVILTSSRGSAAYGPRIGASRAAGFIPKDELSAAGLLSLAG